MRNKTAILGMLAMGAFMSGTETLVGQGKIGTSNPIEPEPPKPPTPFKKEEGVLKMIEDYKLIQNGESKKGRLKQNRIVEKVEHWLATGQLAHEDLK